MKSVTLEKPARQALKRIPKPVAMRIIAKIEQYADHPSSMSAQVKQLVGDHRKRLRVGDWRVLFVEDANDIVVLDVRPRGSAYR